MQYIAKFQKNLLSLFSQGFCLNTLWKNYDLSICISQTRFKHLIPNSCKMIAILHGFLNIFLKHLLAKRFTSLAASIRFQIQLYFSFYHFIKVLCLGKELFTLREFCFAMIVRADIEGSKSSIGMKAWPSISQLYVWLVGKFMQREPGGWV